ncbi:Pls/PosA family non-ribosomal peptide synthetase [Granulicoccus sp. GXG6511]|uniref:Pls/PosA family non-ribosomal peptide synthetase n=1 Tax=Granulicoccus sp. GXG6511 TaxID=3381351 RepID=UPI003D7E1C1A
MTAARRLADGACAPHARLSSARRSAGYLAPVDQPLTRLHHYFDRSVDASPGATALECHGTRLTYAELDALANRLANHLTETRGIAPGARVGIMIDRSVAMYVALLGVQKAGATFIPIDPSAPVDRVAYMTDDSALDLIVTTTALADACAEAPAPVLLMDAEEQAIATASGERPDIDETGDPLCYIIYTSGSTGRPKGVEIAQSSICNFINVVPEIYGVTPSERVYQGMTISFDFSVEEIWPTWAVGATLIAGPTDGRRVGSGLADFLEDAAITMIYCVPTVLATLDRLIPSIRTVNVGGEACPQELVERWGLGRRILNTYGPTEATVTCIWAELYPGKPVTIGVPLPTYTAVLLDDNLRPVPEGEIGEICVGGVGVARGYVNRPDLTAERFVPDPSGETDGRIYRTGDLGRYTEDGEIAYHGRADSEVKVRGHRVELQEIESLLLEDASVSAAVVALLERPGTGGELAGYVLLNNPTESFDPIRTRLHNSLRRRLPAYMVPDYLEVTDTIPMLPSGKADRKAMPEPVSGRLIGGDAEYVAPDNAIEHQLCRVYAETLRLPLESISVTANLFDDLGGHSLIAATLVSHLRRSGAASELSILDLYANPTIRALGAHLADLGAEQAEVAAASPVERPAPAGPGRRLAFTLGQVAVIYFVLLLAMLPLGVIYSINNGEPSWTAAGQLLMTLPFSYLAARWILPALTAALVGRGIRPGVHRMFGLTHLRVWMVHRAMTMSPLGRLAGSPWAENYLRLTGAHIGHGCHIGTAQIPLPSLVRLGDRATVGYAVHLQGYEIVDGRLRIGHIDIGEGAVVGANSVLQGPCTMGAGATLGGQSLIVAGQQVPAGENWSGSVAQPRTGRGDPVIDLMTSCEEAPTRWPLELFPRFALSVVVLELLPMLAMLPVLIGVWWTLLEIGQAQAITVTALSGPVFVLSACALILFFRRWALLATPVGVHHLRSQLGMEKWFGDKLLELSLELTNSLYGTLYTPRWLRLLGARVGQNAEIATIANIDPDLLTLKDGTFVADMASVGPATYANGHVAFRRTEVGDRAFVGNASFIPSGSHLGDGSLVGVQSVPPVTGVPPGTSWLGSPSIFLPAREMYDEFTEDSTFRPPMRKVAARYLAEFVRATLPASLLALSTFCTLFCLSIFARSLPLWGMVLIAPVTALAFSVVVVLVVALMKWVLIGKYRPRVEPLWSGFVRRSEFVTGIYEGTAVPVLLNALEGTLLLGPVLKLFGVKVGRRALVSSTYVTEFDLVHIGPDVWVGPEVSLQTHLFEDRVMKMGVVSLEEGASLGCRAVVLYATSVGERVALAPLSLVMKGEGLPPDTRWAGVPSRIARRTDSKPPALVSVAGTAAEG